MPLFKYAFFFFFLHINAHLECELQYICCDKWKRNIYNIYISSHTNICRLLYIILPCTYKFILYTIWCILEDEHKNTQRQSSVNKDEDDESNGGVGVVGGVGGWKEEQEEEK